jgi:integrase
MARPRKLNKNLPPCVYPKHGAYYLVRAGKWTRLGSDLPSALAAYARLYVEAKGTMPLLIETVLLHIKPRVAESTHAQYAIAARKLQSILAEFSPEQVLPKHVAQIKLALGKTPNMANRVLSFLRQVFDYALEQQLVDSNPAIGIKRHREAKRERLITQEEYQAIYAQAGPRLQVIMDLLYLTGQRVDDVLHIRRADLLDAGIAFEQQKTGARLVVKWTPELEDVVARAKRLHGRVETLTLLRGRTGKAPDYRSVREQWDKACQAAGVPDAHLHDLRAMAATAVGKDQASALLGHADARTTRIYLRGREIPVVEGPSFRRLIDAKKNAQ